MKSILTAAIVFVMSCFAFGSASAQASSRVKVEIPFAFAVGEATVPAGTYTISAEPGSLFVRLENVDGTRHYSVLAQQDSTSREASGRLVFHRYGEQYFLSRISKPGLFANLHFAPTKAEKRAKTRVEEAGVSADDPVIVGLN